MQEFKISASTCYEYWDKHINLKRNIEDTTFKMHNLMSLIQNGNVVVTMRDIEDYRARIIKLAATLDEIKKKLILLSDETISAIKG